MRVYIVKGEHFTVPGVPAQAFFQPAEADAAALALVNIIRADVQMEAEANVLRWKEALIEAQRERVRQNFDEESEEDLDDDELAEAAECDVWIEAYEAGEPEAYANIRRYSCALDDLTIPPNGDDFNAVLDMLDGSPYRAPSPIGR